MAYQNINQYVYNKWYLKPVQEVSDLSLASDERQYNEEVVFSPNLIGEFNGDVMPIKIDLNFSGSNQGFVLNYQNYNQQNILISENYFNPLDPNLDCYSSRTICDIGLTGTDNGLLECMSGQSIEYTMGLLPDSQKFDRYKYDRRFKMFQVTGHTWSPNHRFSGVTAGTLYNIVSYNSQQIGQYHELYGGFYQGFYKLFGYDYEVLPTRYPKGWTVEMTLKPRLGNIYTPQSGQTTLNDYYPDNAGIFFYMGTRAENKFWHDANGKNFGDPNYVRVTESLTGLSSCMCEILNSGYTTTSYTNIPIRVSGATIIVEPNLLWQAGDDVLVYHDLLQYIEGVVESYDPVGGQLKFVSTKNVGEGNFPYWRVDKPNYLEYAESYCVKVYPETGYTSGNSITYCSCCVPPPPTPKPEHNPLLDSMSNALAIKFSGDPANPKICVRTLTFTGDCATTGACETIGFESQTGYSINNYCSTRGIYDDCLGTEYFGKEHWVLIDAVFERYTWLDFCDLYYRGGLGVISNLVYTATTANNSVSLIQPPLTHNQTIPVQEEIVELNYDWLLEEFYRRGKLKLYVNGRHFETFDNFEEIIPRGLYGHKETQVGVPFNISWGGGTQGLHENLIFSAIPQTFCGEYIQDPELFPDNILSGTSVSGLTTNILLEKYFAGTFDGGISTFHMYSKPLSVPEIQHNARLLYNVYDLLNPYCLDCNIIDNCDLDWEFIEVTNTPTPTTNPTQTPTPTQTVTPSATLLPSLCLYTQLFETTPQTLPPSGYINSRPYYVYTDSICGNVYKIFYDGTQWITENFFDNTICATLNYQGLYPDTNFASWVITTGLPLCECDWVRTTTYPVPCTTPPPTPTPSTTAGCCESVEFTLPDDICSMEILYLDCDNNLQTTVISGTTPVTICMKNVYSNFEILSTDCLSYDILELGNCDCGLVPTPTPTLTQSVTPTQSITPTITSTPSLTPTQTPSPTSDPCCRTHEVNVLSGSCTGATITYVDCDDDTQTISLVLGSSTLICARPNSITLVPSETSCDIEIIETINCDCTIPETPTPTPTPTITSTVTPTITLTQTPSTTPDFTPTQTPTTTVTPSATPPCCSTYNLYSMVPETYTIVNCDGTVDVVSHPAFYAFTVCALSVTPLQGYIFPECECCLTVTGTSITANVLDIPNASSYSRGSATVGYWNGSSLFNPTGSATKATGNTLVTVGGDLGNDDNCQRGAIEVTAFVPSSIAGATGYRTQITITKNSLPIGVVTSGPNPTGSNVTQTFDFDRNNNDVINVQFNSIL